MTADQDKFPLAGDVALVTGASRRIGACTARHLHAHGCNVAIHCHQSVSAAEALVSELNSLRSLSAMVIESSLGRRAQAEYVVESAVATWGQLNIVINNASSFFPTPMGEITDDQVDNLLSSNFCAPLFVTQAAASHLRSVSGCVVNMIDVHAYRPLMNHSAYSAAKAGLDMLTQSHALEMAPDIRVNGIAPGVILWPEGKEAPDESMAAERINQIPLQSQGTVEDIANTVYFLVSPSARYITGQIITVDGGKTLSQSL